MSKIIQVIDVSEMRSTFAEVRSQMDELQKKFFAVEQMYIKKFSELEQLYMVLFDELNNIENGKI